MELIDYLIKNSDFFQKNFNYIKVEKGKSKTIKFLCRYNEEKYFVKIIDGNIEKKLIKIYRIYNDNNILTPKIVYLKYFEDIDKTCIVSYYIDGKSLLDIMNNKSCDELEKIGFFVGNKLRKFKYDTSNKKNIIDNLNKKLENMKKNAYILQDKFTNLPFIDLDRIFKSLENNKKYVYLTKPKFIHGDVTFNNVILKDDKIYFIDIDGGKYNFRSLDFKGNWWWTWQGDNILKEQALYRGIYKGLFCGIIPKQFHKELAFTMIYTFLSRLEKYKDNYYEIQYTFLKFKEMFEKTDYYEDYYFEWF